MLINEYVAMKLHDVRKHELHKNESRFNHALNEIIMEFIEERKRSGRKARRA